MCGSATGQAQRCLGSQKAGASASPTCQASRSTLLWQRQGPFNKLRLSDWSSKAWVDKAEPQACHPDHTQMPPVALPVPRPELLRPNRVSSAWGEVHV